MYNLTPPDHALQKDTADATVSTVPREHMKIGGKFQRN